VHNNNLKFRARDYKKSLGFEFSANIQNVGSNSWLNPDKTTYIKRDYKKIFMNNLYLDGKYLH